MELSYIIFVVLFILRKYESAPVYSNVKTDSPPLSAIEFMKKYGYLESGTSDSDALYNKSAITDALKTLQKFGNVPVTGQLDNTTLQLMASPRCGVPDILRKQENQQRKKRYVIGSEGWKKQHITYFIANWTPKLGEEAVTTEIERALNAWSGYSRLNFKRTRKPTADIVITFGRGPHGDASVLQNKQNNAY